MKVLLLAAAAAGTLLVGAPGWGRDVVAGNLKDPGDAKERCPRVCHRVRSSWNGNWTCSSREKPWPPGCFCGCKD